MIRFCIVGAGFIGGVHAQALSAIPEAKVTVVCDSDSEKARVLASQVGALGVTEYQEAVRRQDVDAVCVCTPSGMHAEVALAAAAAGKHLVIEKPIEINLERTDRILEAARQAGVKLTCIFPFRFMKGVYLARQAVQAGRLGKLVLASAYIKWYRTQAYYNGGGWKGTWALDGGGALMNQGIHNIDLLCHLAGPASQVAARTAILAHHMETEDTAAAVLVFQSGALGVIEGTTGSWPGDRGRVELHGDCGTIALEDGRIVVWKLADAPEGEEAAMLQIENTQGSGAGSATGIGSELHRRQLADFVDAVQQNRPPAIAGEEARKPVALIRAIYDSSAQSGWISL